MPRKQITVLTSEDMDAEALKQEVYLLTDDDSLMREPNEKVLAWRGDLFNLSDEQQREVGHLRVSLVGGNVSSISDVEIKARTDLLAIIKSLDIDIDRVLSHGVTTADAYGRPEDLLWMEKEKGVVFLTMDFVDTETEVHVPEGYETPDGERGPIDVQWGVQLMEGILGVDGERYETSVADLDRP